MVVRIEVSCNGHLDMAYLSRRRQIRSRPVAPRPHWTLLRKPDYPTPEPESKFHFSHLFRCLPPGSTPYVVSSEDLQEVDSRVEARRGLLVLRFLGTAHLGGLGQKSRTDTPSGPQGVVYGSSPLQQEKMPFCGWRATEQNRSDQCRSDTTHTSNTVAQLQPIFPPINPRCSVSDTTHVVTCVSTFQLHLLLFLVLPFFNTVSLYR